MVPREGPGWARWLGDSTSDSAPVLVVEGVPSARRTEAVGGIVEYVRYRGITPVRVEAIRNAPTASIRNTDTQYAIRNAPHGLNTEYGYAIRNTQITQQGPARPQYGIRNTQYAICNSIHSRGRLATTSEIAKLKLIVRPIGRRRVHAL